MTSLGNSSDLILMFDDENAYEYLSENRAGCMDTLASLIEKRIGKKSRGDGQEKIIPQSAQRKRLWT